MELAKISPWQKCPNCGVMVERIDGCVFIRCRRYFCQQCYMPLEWSSCVARNFLSFSFMRKRVDGAPNLMYHQALEQWLLFDMPFCSICCSDK
ncbi:hypothetical protein Taro_014718, partial [Colocasia esculenta]|nr:hypothetical protein [Colocasia esculenta]